jgi:V8-like Glu-specific endopeptidase
LFDRAPDAPDTPGAHFCSASVVDSAAGDVAVTAAHCVATGDGSPPRTGMLFVPGYHDGETPFGVWTVTAAVVDPSWQDGADPAHDVAFLTVARNGSPPVEELTGGYRLAADPEPDVRVDAVGYPEFADAPTVRSGTAHRISPTQLELDAEGLYDGTSGGPWLREDDEIIGVTGGYEQGGLTPDVSYASYFDDSVTALLDEAVAPPARAAG